MKRKRTPEREKDWVGRLYVEVREVYLRDIERRNRFNKSGALEYPYYERGKVKL